MRSDPCCIVGVYSSCGVDFASVRVLTSSWTTLEMKDPPVMAGDRIDIGFVAAWCAPDDEPEDPNHRLRVVGKVDILRRLPSGSFLVEVELQGFRDEARVYPLGIVDQWQHET